MNLDAQQTIAVRTSSKRALVLAGAGSGKTRTLIERIAYLTEECKVSPYEIMAFTFTRKAAGEIKTRLQERIGNKAYHVTMGTMHALSLSMINRFGEIIGLKQKQVTVYCQWEEEFLLKDVAQEMGIFNGKNWKIKKADIDGMFGTYYQRGIEPKEDDPLYPLFRAFIQRCRENNSLTYGGLLIGLRLLIPTMAKYLHIEHILVDEVQDIDHLQWAIILEMEKAFNAELFLVGDIDQSIYEWRGAAPKYLVDHQSEFDIYRMEVNYRSVPEIVTAANKLIEHNQDRITKTMTAARNQFFLYDVRVLKNIDSEAIVGLFIEDPADRPIAVLARNHSLLQKIDRLMEEANISHVYIGKNTALTNSEPFRRFHAFLKLCINPYDNFSFLLIKDVIGLTREEYGKIRLEAAQEGKSHFQVWDWINKENDIFVLLGENAEGLDDSYRLIAERFPDLSPESAAFINEWLKESSSDRIEDYLSWLATYDLQDEIKDESKEEITLMTIHAAKGLEWPVVIVAGCNEGIMPSKQAVISGDIESERRLFYVAMTRAQDQLVLTVRPERTERPGGGFSESPISRFIGEAGC